MTDKEQEMFAWGVIAAVGWMLINRAAHAASGWVLDQCSNPRISLVTLRRIHEKDQEEAQHAE